MASLLTRRITLMLIAACAAAAPACSSSPTTPGGGGTCRTYRTAGTYTSTPNVGAPILATITAAFNSTTKQLTNALIYPSGSICTSQVFSFGSVADFVNEVRVIPPVIVATGETETLGPACGSGMSTRAYTYDSQQRLTQITAGSTITTYTAWDSNGRPTAGTLSTGSSVSITYDSGARAETDTFTRGGSSSVATYTYDANGILIELDERVNQNGSLSTNVTQWTTTSTAMVCQ